MQLTVMVLNIFQKLPGAITKEKYSTGKTDIVTARFYAPNNPIHEIKQKSE